MLTLKVCQELIKVGIMVITDHYGHDRHNSDGHDDHDDNDYDGGDHFVSSTNTVLSSS